MTGHAREGRSGRAGSIGHGLAAMLALLAALAGCVVSGDARDAAEPASIGSLRDLAGCYRNEGAGGEGPKRYLSQVLWPGADLAHAELTVVWVTPVSPDALDVAGLSDGEVAVHSRFTEGSDFVLESGRITVRNRLFGSLAARPGNPFIGAGRESVTLGLDEGGHGMLSETTTFAGTAFVVIPVAGRVSGSLRFRRVSGECAPP